MDFHSKTFQASQNTGPPPPHHPHCRQHAAPSQPPPLSPLLSQTITATISPSSPPLHHQRGYEVRASRSSLQSNHPTTSPLFSQLAPCRGSNHKNHVMDAGWGLLLPKEEGMKSRTGEDRWVGEEEISSEEMKCRVDWSVSQSHSSLRFGGEGGFWGLQRDDGGDQSVSGRRTFASCRAAKGSFPRGVREVKLRNLIILDGL